MSSCSHQRGFGDSSEPPGLLLVAAQHNELSVCLQRAGWGTACPAIPAQSRADPARVCPGCIPRAGSNPPHPQGHLPVSDPGAVEVKPSSGVKSVPGGQSQDDLLHRNRGFLLFSHNWEVPESPGRAGGTEVAVWVWCVTALSHLFPNFQLTHSFQLSQLIPSSLNQAGI